jgi:hypothetical protein
VRPMTVIILDLPTHYCPFSLHCLSTSGGLNHGQFEANVVSSFVALLPLAQLAILTSPVSWNHCKIGSRFSRQADFLIVIVTQLRRNW